MHIHILGICGTFMGSLAQLAKAQGHHVTGSDQNVYPPMSDQLEAAGITLTQGYDPAQLEPAPDLVVVGNALSRGNPAVEAVLALKKRGYTAVALEHTTRSQSYTRINYRFPLVFVVGNEGVGIQDEVVAACDFAVELPQYGMKSSMNVAVAFGIMLYELRRQWDLQQKR